MVLAGGPAHTVSLINKLLSMTTKQLKLLNTIGTLEVSYKVSNVDDYPSNGIYFITIQLTVQ